jgi:hypothetical protein
MELRLKKISAWLLLLVLLAPNAAWATYSCFGTNRPCDLSEPIRASALKSDKAQKHKKKKSVKKKKAKKQKTKKHASKRQKKQVVPQKIACDPTPAAASSPAPTVVP